MCFKAICQILKINNETCFVLHLMILNLTVVSKINLKWPVYQVFSTSSFKQFKLERPEMEKLKSKHLDGVFEIFLIV